MDEMYAALLDRDSPKLITFFISKKTRKTDIGFRYLK